MTGDAGNSSDKNKENYFLRAQTLKSMDKENTNLKRNADNQAVKIDKISLVLNNLNNKVIKFDMEKKQVEEEILKRLCASTNTLNTDRSLTELSEMLTIQDYQSMMESKIGTEAVPTARDDILTEKAGERKA